MSEKEKEGTKASGGVKCMDVFWNGLIKENPTFVLMLGMCPTLAVTSSAVNGLGMGLTTTVVLTLSNVIISLLRNVIPDKVRIPAFIVIIASFVTIVGQFLQAYIPSLNDALGMFIPLIVVNCIILGRAEAFASKNNCLLSAFDGLGMGLGFTAALTCIGLVREIFGSHKVFGISFAELSQMAGLPQAFTDWLGKQYPIAILVMAPGAFFILAILTAIQNVAKEKQTAKGKKPKIQTGCGSDCASCGDTGCNHRFYDPDGKDTAVGKKDTAVGKVTAVGKDAVAGKGAEGVKDTAAGKEPAAVKIEKEE